MLKASIFIVLGIVAGAGLATLLDREPLPALDAGNTTIVADAGAGDALVARIAALETALIEETERRAALEAGFSRLAEQLGGLATTATDTPVGEIPNEGIVINAAVEGVRGPMGTRFAAMREQRSPEYLLTQLVEAGFSADQAQSLVDRQSQMRLDMMNASYEARRQGERIDSRAVQREADAELRGELGDDAYTRYLEAMGQPTSVSIFEVIDSSAGQTAGLQSGDEIVGYNGERVFSLRDLQALTIAGEPGETVPVDVLRDGQSMQLYISRGPLGITGGGRGRNFGFVEALPVSPP